MIHPEHLARIAQQQEAQSSRLYEYYTQTEDGMGTLVEALADELSTKDFDSLFAGWPCDVDQPEAVCINACLGFFDFGQRRYQSLSVNGKLIWNALDEMASRLANGGKINRAA